MNRRRGASSIVANPVLVGAVTTLVVIVAIFLAYNANNGLPFVPTKIYKVQIDNGANLVKGNEVREGGYRIGVVEEMKPVLLENGSTVALLSIKLDKKTGDLPADSTFKIRPRSALGLKYLELTKGTSSTTFQDGDTVPVEQSTVPVDLDEFYNMFDAKTREAAQRNLYGFGNAFAMRGQDLNVTITALPELFGELAPVARNLADPNTNIRRFFDELGDAARIVAPVADAQANFFAVAATTFEAFSRDPEALKQTISESPATLSVGTESFRAQRPFLRHTAAFSAELERASEELPSTLAAVNPALEVGTPVVQRVPEANERLETTLNTLRELAEAPGTGTALRGLAAAVTTLNPQLRYLGPYVTVCNSWNLFWTLAAEHFGEADPTGAAQRALLNTTGRQDNSLGSQGAKRQANGQNVIEGDPQHLHGQVYTAAIDNEGNADCENGQRGYVKKLNALGDQSFNVAVDPHTPGNQGPTWLSPKDQGGKLSPSKTAPGQTFTREPDTGPQIAAGLPK